MVAARGGFMFLGQHRDIGFDGGSGVLLSSRRLGDTRYLYGSEGSLCQQLVSLFERDAEVSRAMNQQIGGHVPMDVSDC